MLFRSVVSELQVKLVANLLCEDWWFVEDNEFEVRSEDKRFEGSRSRVFGIYRYRIGSRVFEIYVSCSGSFLFGKGFLSSTRAAPKDTRAAPG